MTILICPGSTTGEFGGATEKDCIAEANKNLWWYGLVTITMPGQISTFSSDLKWLWLSQSSACFQRRIPCVVTLLYDSTVAPTARLCTKILQTNHIPDLFYWPEISPGSAQIEQVWERELAPPHTGQPTTTTDSDRYTLSTNWQQSGIGYHNIIVKIINSMGCHWIACFCHADGSHTRYWMVL